MPDVTICLDVVTDSVKMQINSVCELDFKLNVEHDINVHDVKQFASEVCNVFPDANWTCDVSDKPVSNVVSISSCKVWDVWQVRLQSDSSSRIAGSAKTISQPILSENKTELGRAGGDNSWIR